MSSKKYLQFALDQFSKLQNINYNSMIGESTIEARSLKQSIGDIFLVKLALSEITCICLNFLINYH